MPTPPVSDPVEDDIAAVCGPGGRRPTINDIARWTGVSKKTVSRVINGSPFVNAQTRERIQVVIARAGFAPDPQARGLASRRSFLIGLVCDHPDPAVAIGLQQGILDALAGSGFDLVVSRFEGADGISTFARRLKLWGLVLGPTGAPGRAAMPETADCAVFRTSFCDAASAREQGRLAASALLGAVAAAP